MNTRKKSTSPFRLRLFLLLFIASIFMFPTISQGVDMFGWFKKASVFFKLRS